MSDAPDLSILMVNWNTRDMTLACLRSVFAETRDTSFELILVDNGSADGSAEAIAAEFPQVRVIAESENHGFAKANNIAAKLAAGQYLLLLNTDTVVLDGAIDKIVAFARANPQAKLWGARTLWEDGRLNPTSVWKRITPWSAFSFAVGLRGALSRFEFFNPEGMGHWPRDTVREVDIVAGCFLLMERSFWNALGGFDARFFMYGEEADLCARARRRGQAADDAGRDHRPLWRQECGQPCEQDRLCDGCAHRPCAKPVGADWRRDRAARLHRPCRYPGLCLWIAQPLAACAL